MAERHRISEPDSETKTGVCSVCGPVTITANSSHNDKQYWRCGKYAQEYALRRYHADPDRQRDLWLRRRFGITLEQYNQMFEAQGGLCFRCDADLSDGPLRLAVDHCHETGKVRSLLCGPCNTYLGRLEANMDKLASDLAYIRMHRDAATILAQLDQ